MAGAVEPTPTVEIIQDAKRHLDMATPWHLRGGGFAMDADIDQRLERYRPADEQPPIRAAAQLSKERLGRASRLSLIKVKGRYARGLSIRVVLRP